MREIVVADIGGTHARFALAQIEKHHVRSLGEPITLKTADHASIQLAWEDFASQIGRPLPKEAAFALACPIQGEVMQMTNNPWIIRPKFINPRLGLERHLLINDFGAVGYAVNAVGEEYLHHLAGPEEALPQEGVISIVGPGTGLGVGLVVRSGRKVQVISTEGGHLDFAPLDSIEDQILAHMRKIYRRVSYERIVSGPGIVGIYEVLAAMEGQVAVHKSDKDIWASALEGRDALAVAAMDRFCMSLGSVAGDIALAQGGKAIVIAGGLGLRLKDHLATSGFAKRLVAKGRFEGMMTKLPVKIITHPQPGLLGVAAAFAHNYGDTDA